MKVHVLALKNLLSQQELISLHSFILQGYKVILYTDIIVDNVPQDIEVRDILEVSETKRLFKFNVLLKEGGIWCDMSVRCLRYLDVQEEHQFYGDKVIKAPKGSWILKLLLTEGFSFLDGKKELEKLRLKDNSYFEPIVDQCMKIRRYEGYQGMKDVNVRRELKYEGCEVGKVATVDQLGKVATVDQLGKVDIRMKNDKVSLFWNKGTLGPLELLTLRTLLHFGHEVLLYTCTKVDNVPSGINVLDVKEVATMFFVTEFNYQAALHSIKYRALKKTGGWWIDMGVILLKPLYTEREHLLGTSRTSGYSSHVMKAPKDSWICTDLISICSQLIHEGGGCMNEHNDEICTMYLKDRQELHSLIEPLEQTDPISPEGIEAFLLSEQRDLSSSMCLYLRQYPNIPIVQDTMMYKILSDSLQYVDDCA